MGGRIDSSKGRALGEKENDFPEGRQLLPGYLSFLDALSHNNLFRHGEPERNRTGRLYVQGKGRDDDSSEFFMPWGRNCQETLESTGGPFQRKNQGEPWWEGFLYRGSDPQEKRKLKWGESIWRVRKPRGPAGLRKKAGVWLLPGGGKFLSREGIGKWSRSENTGEDTNRGGASYKPEV